MGAFVLHGKSFVYSIPKRKFFKKTKDLKFLVFTKRDYTRRADFNQQTLDEGGALVGVVISKLEPHRNGPLRGYIAMLAVKEEYRGNGIGMCSPTL